MIPTWLFSRRRPIHPVVLLFVAASLQSGVLHVQGHSSGAGAEACPSQSPADFHHAKAQTSPPPYSIVVNETSYSPGVEINVTLQADDSSMPFEGFLLGAHRVTGNTTEYLGSFQATSDAQQLCGSNGNTGATHTNPNEKNNLTLIWTPPGSAEGDIRFTSAFVKEFTTFWVNVASATLSPNNYPPSNDTTTPAANETSTPAANETTSPASEDTTAPSSSKFPKDSACGVTKSCYGDCKEDGCTFLVTWSKAGENSLSIALKSVTSGDNVWAAVGFGTEAAMNPASVTECVANGPQVKAFTSFNKDYDNKRVSNETAGLSDVSGHLVDGLFSCSVSRQLVVPGGDPDVYNLANRLYHIMLARGLANDWNKSPHDNGNAFVTSKSFNLSAVVDSGTHVQSYPLVKLHGCLMTLAWLLSASIGVLVARFYKVTWPTQTACGGVKVWFAIHRLTMVIAFIATAAGFAIIFIHVKGYSHIMGENYEKAHPILGIIVTTLTVINPIMSMFRCGPNHDYRPLFNWAHWLVGTSAYILGVLTVGIGTQLQASQTEDYVTYIVAAFACWHLLAHCLLEVNKYLERNDSTLVGVYKDLQTFSTSYDGKKYQFFRHAIFALHVVVALGVCIAVAVAVIGI